MNDREITAAAQRWFLARGRRMAANKHKRNCDATDGFGAYRAQIDARANLKEARRQERAALKVLAKACEAQRGQQIEDAGTVRYMRITTGPMKSDVFVGNNAPKTAPK